MTRFFAGAAAILTCFALAALPLRAQEASPRKFVVLVGIGSYADARIKARPHAEADAKALWDLFTSKNYYGVEADHIRLLLGKADEGRGSQPATRANILKALHWLAAEAQAGDLVVFAFIGQGATLNDEGDRLGYFASDSSVAERAVNVVSAAAIAEELDRLKSRHFCAFLDVSFQDFTIDGKPGPEPVLGDSPYREFRGKQNKDAGSFAPGRAVFLATSGLERSLDVVNHGLFAKVIIDGLKGAADREGYEPDGVVTTAELADYLDKEIPAAAARLGETVAEKQQKSFVLRGAASRFVLTRNPSVAPKIRESVAQLDQLAADQKISRELAGEGRALLSLMPRLAAGQALRKEYQRLAEGGLTPEDFAKSRNAIRAGTRLYRFEAIDFARKVIVPTHSVQASYIKKVSRTDLVEWAVRGLYQYTDEEVPADIVNRLQENRTTEDAMTVILWDTVRRDVRASLVGHDDAVAALALTGDGKTLATAGADSSIKIWDVAGEKQIHTLRGHSGSVASVAFSGDGKTLVSGGTDRTVKIWNVETGKERRTYKGHSNMVAGVAVSPDGKYAASTSGVHDPRARRWVSGEIKIWDLTAEQELHGLKGHASLVSCVAFSADGEKLATGGWDREAIVWDVVSGQAIATFKGHTREVRAVAFTSDDKTLASAGGDATIRLWDVATEKTSAILSGHAAGVLALAFNGDGKTLASVAQDRTVVLWDVATGKKRAVLQKNGVEAVAVALSADGKTLITGGQDRLTVLLADVRERLGRREDLASHKDIDVALQRMLARLDNLTTYIDPASQQRYQLDVQKQLTGIGASVRKNPASDFLDVVNPIKGGPAYKAGVRAGDVITTITCETDAGGKPLAKVEVTSTRGVPLTGLVSRLQGKAGTKVKIALRREGSEEPLDFEIERALVETETVLGSRRDKDDDWIFLLDPGSKIGYIRLTVLVRASVRDLEQALRDLKKKEMKGLILDLRFTTGGLLDSSVKIADMFIDDGTIVTIRPRRGRETVYTGKREGSYLDFPMVCLINGTTASGAEIVAACLQDHKRAAIMGERSIGLASSQNITPYDGGLIKLTTARFWRPSGKNIHKANTTGNAEDEWGVLPDKDFVLTLPTKERNALGKQLEYQTLIPPRDRPLPRSDFKDRQLGMALEYLRGQVKKAGP